MQTKQFIATLLSAIVGVQALPQAGSGGNIATIEEFSAGGCTGTNTTVPIFGQINTCQQLATPAVSAIRITPLEAPGGCSVVFFTGTNCGTFGDEPAAGACTQGSTPYRSIIVKCPGNA